VSVIVLPRRLLLYSPRGRRSGSTVVGAKEGALPVAGSILRRGIGATQCGRGHVEYINAFLDNECHRSSVVLASNSSTILSQPKPSRTTTTSIHLELPHLFQIPTPLAPASSYHHSCPCLPISAHCAIGPPRPSPDFCAHYTIQPPYLYPL
jgi:hypothetical protein